MFFRKSSAAATVVARGIAADNEAQDRWANEGGAAPPPPLRPTTPIPIESSLGRIDEPVLTKEATNALDERQQEIMTVESTDRQPPSRRQRAIGWRWFGAGALLLITAAATWIGIQGLSAQVAIGGIVLAAVLVAGASPVLGAGLMRGTEERAAGREARIERRQAEAR